MAGELAVSFVLKLNDQGSAAAARALQTVTRALKETETVAKTSSQAAISAFQKLGSSREVLGIRSEKAIQNEIRQTEAAYKRLATSGQASARELGRAQDAMRQKVAGLRRELDGVKDSAGGAGRALQTATGAVAAVTAAKMVVQDPVRRTMDYSMELAHTSNVMFSGRSVAERIASKQQINDAVMAGVRAAQGTVTREAALAGVKAIASSGEFGNDPRAVFGLLPTVTRAAGANNASVTDIANVAIRARQNMGLTNAERVLDMSAQGGIEGAFELRDQAKWLPQQMAYAERTGLKGEEGFATIIALNQMSTRTAGTTDEAGNNVKNFLAKVNSPDTAADAKKMGIDLSGSLAAAQAKNVGGVDAFLNLLEQTAAKDPRISKLRAEAKSAKGEDLVANLKAQEGILAGTAVGKWMQDMQALGPAVAVLGDRDKFNEIRSNVLAARGTNADMLPVISSEPAAKAQLAAAEAANNMQNALNNVNPLIGAAADGFSSLSKEFPTLAAAVTGTKLGVEALGAAALTAAGAVALLGGGKAAGGALGTVLDKGKGALGAAGGLLSRVAGPAAAVTGAFGVGYGVGTVLNYGINGAISWATGRDNSLGGLIYDMTHGDELKKNASPPVSMSFQDMQRAPRGREGGATVPFRIENVTYLDNRVVAESVNEYNARQASRN